MNRRTLSEARKKLIAARQKFRCANRPGSNLKGLDNYMCLLWKEPGEDKGIFDESLYEIDHIDEFAISGNDSDDNLQALCNSCHAYKTRKFMMQSHKEKNINMEEYQDYVDNTNINDNWINYYLNTIISQEEINKELIVDTDRKTFPTIDKAKNYAEPWLDKYDINYIENSIQQDRLDAEKINIKKEIALFVLNITNNIDHQTLKDIIIETSDVNVVNVINRLLTKSFCLNLHLNKTMIEEQIKKDALLKKMLSITSLEFLSNHNVFTK